MKYPLVPNELETLKSTAASLQRRVLVGVQIPNGLVLGLGSDLFMPQGATCDTSGWPASPLQNAFLPAVL